MDASTVRNPTLTRQSKLHEAIHTWLVDHTGERGAIDINCEMPMQLDHALRLQESSTNRKVEAMSLSINLLQEMIINER